MLRHGRYVLSEIGLGILDNLKALKQMILHPIATLIAFAKAIFHPIQTLKGIWQFFVKSPVRFLTNLGLSFLEGRLLMFGWEKMGSVVQISDVANPILSTNATVTAGESVLQEGIFQGFFKAFSGAPKPPPCCTAAQCTMPGFVPAGGATSTATTVLETRAEMAASAGPQGATRPKLD